VLEQILKVALNENVEKHQFKIIWKGKWASSINGYGVRHLQVCKWFVMLSHNKSSTHCS